MAGDYAQKLKDPRWQKMRLRILERDQWHCMCCADATSTLHVHHRRYISGLEPWEYPEALLVTLCETCHATESQDIKPAIDELVAVMKETFLSCDIKRFTFMVRFLGMPSYLALLSECRRRKPPKSGDASEEHF